MLDGQCRTLDFHRLLPKTDANLHYDKFNRLRLSDDKEMQFQDHGVTLPDHIRQKQVRLEWYPLSQLVPADQTICTQDLAIFDVPHFAVMANAQHYNALYNVVTNLILYQDPDERQRSQKIDTFIYSFDPQDAFRYVKEVAQLQQRIRELESLGKAYDDFYDLLTTEGKLGLIDIYTDLLDSVDMLTMIFDTVAAHRNSAERAAALQASLRLRVRAGEVAWFMVGPDALLAKLAMKGTHFDWLRKKDSSTESTLIIDDLQALNTSADAVFPEIVAKYKSGIKDNKVRLSIIARARTYRTDVVSSSFSRSSMPAGLFLLPSVGSQSLRDSKSKCTQPSCKSRRPWAVRSWTTSS